MTDMLDTIQTHAADISAEFDGYDPAVVQRFAEYSLSLAGFARAEGIHPFDRMQEAARLGVTDTVGVEEVDALAPALMADEALCRAILQADETIYGNQVG